MLSPKQLDRLLLTGAAGGLGQVLRASLKPFARTLRVSDIADVGTAGPGEETQVCNLADKAAVDRLVQGCDAVVHLGGVSVERPFEEVLEANIKGVFHLYEGARRHGVKRVVFASSNHEVMRSIWPFYGALLIALMLVTYVPAFSLWLPGLVLSK